MEMTRMIMNGIDKYSECAGKQPEVIRITPRGMEQLSEEWNQPQLLPPKHMREFLGIKVETLEPEAPGHMIFLLK